VAGVGRFDWLDDTGFMLLTWRVRELGAPSLPARRGGGSPAQEAQARNANRMHKRDGRRDGLAKVPSDSGHPG
jgi:hypothetical protein